MPNFNFLPDPSLYKLKEAYRKLCSNGEPGKPYLTLIDETLFILCGAKTLGEFPLFFDNYPVDSKLIVSTQVLPNEEYTLYDNKLNLLAPTDPLNPDKQYARAFVLMIKYPDQDDVANQIDYIDKNVYVNLFKNDSIIPMSVPIYNFYSMFNNPVTIMPNEVIDKVTITNPNATYSIYINALIIYVKSSILQNDPKCN